MEEECEIKKKRVVVIGMDGSKESEAAFNFYAQNVHRKDDDVIVCNVVHHTAHYMMGSVWAPIDAQAVARGYEEETAKSMRICEQIDEMLKKKEITGRVMQTSGDPGHKIVAAAEEFGAELIVVGCRGLGTIRRTLVGSVSDFVAHHSHVPVFVCRSQ